MMVMLLLFNKRRTPSPLCPLWELYCVLFGKLKGLQKSVGVGGNFGREVVILCCFATTYTNNTCTFRAKLHRIFFPVALLLPNPLIPWPCPSFIKAVVVLLRTGIVRVIISARTARRCHAIEEISSWNMRIIIHPRRHCQPRKTARTICRQFSPDRILYLLRMKRHHCRAMRKLTIRLNVEASHTMSCDWSCRPRRSRPRRICSHRHTTFMSLEVGANSSK